MNTLITGGTGLLGREINIENSTKPSRHDLNLMNYEELKNYVYKNNIKSIIHCAAKVGGVKANDEFANDFFIENLQINTNVLRVCSEFKIKNNIFLLSTCVFPEHANLPLSEENINSGEPHSTNFGYAYSKRILEIGARTMYKQHGIKSKCLIPCNLYGKHDNYNLETGHVIPNLIHKCYVAKQNNTSFVVWGTGEEEREFMYSADFSHIIKLIHKFEHLPQNIIIAPEKNYKICEIVEIICKIINFKGSIIYTKQKNCGVFKKPTSNTVFRQFFPDFNFTPIELGLTETIEHFIKNYESVRK
jgi:GDP-L-fucose synthase